jgi:YD repeat-containing protein
LNRWSVLLFGALVVMADARSAVPERWQAWSLEGEALSPEAPSAFAPEAVGSIQKPWVLKAWAIHNSSKAAPQIFCPGSPDCWRIGGHGWLGLRRATAESCNAYFRKLAAEVSEQELEEAFREAGFETSLPLTPDRAIGLGGSSGAITISPFKLLNAFRELIRQPWPSGETHRLELLRGLEEAGRSGTAAGSGLRGLLVKTGTSSRGGTSIEAMTGWALAASLDAEQLVLGRLESATGRMAAVELGSLGLMKAVESNTAPVQKVETVRVWVFSALRIESLSATNLSPAPMLVEGPAGERWVGQGGRIDLMPGDRLAQARWQLDVAPYGLKRRFFGSITIGEGRGATLGRVVLSAPSRDYVEGVLKAELKPGDSERTRDLAATILRFVKRPAPHDKDGVCDRNHCAWFLGEGPYVIWKGPKEPLHVAATEGSRPRLDDAAWQSARIQANEPGPDLWSDHCGGETLSEWEVWGRGSKKKWRCLRHPGATAYWQRSFRAKDLDALFGGPVSKITCEKPGGFRRTAISLARGTQLRLTYDELHRRLAARHGWSCLPSPPENVRLKNGRWLFSGHGSGHRVGFCMAD